MKKVKRVCAFLAAILIGVCGFGGCGKDEKEQDITVYMPDGAPAMAFAQMMREDTDDDGVTYRVVNPSVIATKVTNNNTSKNADICALPVIAASKLLGTGENYQMLGVLTSGNLYVLSKNDTVIADFAASEYANLSHLIGKTVGVMKINEVPGMTFKSILQDYGVEWQELTNDAEAAADKINLKPIADATEMTQDDSVACYVVAEPAASVQIKKNNFVSVCSLEILYYKGKIPMDCTGGTYIGYPQAVLVAKKSLIQEREDFIQEFLEDVKTSALAWRNTDVLNGEQIVSAVTEHLEDSGYTSTLNASVLTFETIERCGISFSENTHSKGAVISYLQRILAVNPKATKLPEDSFFYMGR